MRTPGIAAAVALVALTTACGGEPEPAQTSQPAPPASAQPESPPAESSPPGESSAPAQDSGERVLIGTVGETENPEAFTITLTDSAGAPVTTAPAGTYQVKVTDLATFHNFHLTGPGVDEATTVPETGEVTWDVTLQPGSYTYVCDPHARGMVGELTVT